MKPGSEAENRFLEVVMRGIAERRNAARRHRIGPGEASILNVHRRLGQSRYTGAALRRLAVERGVGRPPANVDRGLDLLA